MNERVRLLTEEARTLAPLERVELVERVLASLDTIDPRADALWIAEAEDRLDAYSLGNIGSHDFDEVIAARVKAK